MKNLDFCIDALRGAMMLSGQALQIEVAVAFIVFDSLGSADLDARKTLRSIYASAGRADCLTAGSPSYQTVNRRMARCAGFYEAVGQRKVAKVLKGLEGQAAVDAIVALIEPYQAQTMDDLAKEAGKEPQRAKEAPGTLHLKHEHIKVDLAPDVTEDEILEVIKELRAILKQKHSIYRRQ